MIWYESGGEGSRTILLLHGLGATAAVWKPVERALQERGTWRWLAADLGGHGGSDWHSFYSVGQLAAQLAELAQQREFSELFVVGHSVGAYRFVASWASDRRSAGQLPTYRLPASSRHVPYVGTRAARKP
jgi:pimeloyl-ACP methyl ester carboxylesterase